MEYFLTCELLSESTGNVPAAELNLPQHLVKTSVVTLLSLIPVFVFHYKKNHYSSVVCFRDGILVSKLRIRFFFFSQQEASTQNFII